MSYRRGHKVRCIGLGDEMLKVQVAADARVEVVGDEPELHLRKGLQQAFGCGQRVVEAVQVDAFGLALSFALGER